MAIAVVLTKEQEMALKFAVQKTAEKDAPAPKRTVAEIPELAQALAALPKGSHILIANSDVAADIARVHVQRAQKARTDVKFVTRTKGEALGVYAVAPDKK